MGVECAEKVKFGGGLKVQGKELGVLPCERFPHEGFDVLKFTPENPVSQIPVILAPGYHSRAGSFEILIHSLNERGFTVYVTDYIPNSPNQPVMSVLGRKKNDVNKVKKSAVASAFDLAFEQGADQVHFAAHSKGNIDGFDTLLKHKDKVASWLMMAPRGILKNRNAAHAVLAMAGGDVRNMIDKFFNKRKYKGEEEFRSNSKIISQREKDFGMFDLQYVAEAVGPVKKKFQDKIREIREGGTQAMVMAQAHDGYYPAKELSHIIDSQGVPLDGFVVVKGKYGGLHGGAKYDKSICDLAAEILVQAEQNMGKVGFRETHSKADIENVVDMHERLYTQWDHTFVDYVADTFKKFNPKKDRLWVAEKNGKTIGSIGLIAYPDGRAQLRWLLVDPNERSEGLGTQLVSKVIKYCRDNGFQSICLDTTKDLEDAARLYKKRGFKQISENAPKKMWGTTVVEQRYDLSL